jgi:hypothetical protein
MRAKRWMAGLAAAVLVLGAVPARAYAHCDTMDGPVVEAARQALASGELEPMLIWVRAQDEPEVRHVYAHAQRVRALGGDAATLADRFFFETVVRLHREGEGEPYTGLKPAGTDVGRAVPAIDRALAGGSAEALRHLLHEMVDTRLDEYLADARRLQAFAPADVAAGRVYVAAYVRLMHFGEMLEALATGHGAHAHGGATPAHPAGHAH